MANVCGTSLHVCRIRATRLDDVGNVSDWTCSNHYYGQDPQPTDVHDEYVEPCDQCGSNGDENGIREFVAWESCDGCGSHLGGQRFRLAIHQEE